MSVSLVLGGLVPGRGCLAVAARPEVDFQPRRLVVPDEVAEHIEVVDLKVDDCSHLITYAGFPAAVFSASAKDVDVDFPPVVRGASFCVVIRNVGDVERRFEAVVEGREATCEDVAFAKLGRQVGRTVVGLGCVDVPAGQWRDVQIMPELSFCPERLVVPSEYARGLVVEDVQVWSRGREGVVLASCPRSVTADACGVGSEERLKLMNGCYMCVGDLIKVKVSNRALEDKVFSGAILGSYRY